MAGNMPAYNFNSSSYQHLNLNDLSLSSNDLCSLSLSNSNIPFNVDAAQYTPERRAPVTPCVSQLDVHSGTQTAHTQKSNKKSFNKQMIPRLARQQNMPMLMKLNNGSSYFNPENTFGTNFIHEYQNFILPNSVEEVLANLNLLHYLKCFCDHEVDITVFISLNEDDLKEIGVERLGARRRIINYLNNLRSMKLTNSCNIVHNKDSGRTVQCSIIDQSSCIIRQAMDDIMGSTERMLDCHRHLSREIVSNLAWARLSMDSDIQNWLRKMEENARQIQEVILALKLNF